MKAYLEIDMPESCAECNLKVEHVYGMFKCRYVDNCPERYCGKIRHHHDGLNHQKMICSATSRNTVQKIIGHFPISQIATNAVIEGFG